MGAAGAELNEYVCTYIYIQLHTYVLSKAGMSTNTTIRWAIFRTSRLEAVMPNRLPHVVGSSDCRGWGFQIIRWVLSTPQSDRFQPQYLIRSHCGSSLPSRPYLIARQWDPHCNSKKSRTLPQFWASTSVSQAHWCIERPLLGT